MLVSLTIFSARKTRRHFIRRSLQHEKLCRLSFHWLFSFSFFFFLRVKRTTDYKYKITSSIDQLTWPERVFLMQAQRFHENIFFESFLQLNRRKACHTDILKITSLISFVQRLPSLLKTDIKKYMYGLLRNIIDQDIRVHRYCKV